MLFGFHAQPSKTADIKPELVPQLHQQRVADRLSGPDARLLLYGGLGTGKSLSAILAAERAKELEGGSYAIAAPASLRDNFKKELEKFTTDPSAEVMSYTGLGMGKEFQTQPDTLIGDEVQRLRNPSTASSKAFSQAARRAKRLLLLSGTPIVNAPSDLAAPMSMLTGQNISPTDFTDQFVGQRKVSPGLLAYLSGVSPGEESYIKNEGRLRRLLDGHVDYQPAAKPEGVDIKEETVRVPMTPAQARLQEVIRKKIPTSFLWKLDRQFPLSRDESKRLNAFLVGLRQSSLSPRPFQAKPDNLEAFNQSGKLQEAMRRLKTSFGEDDRRKAIIYSNFIDAGLSPYAAALEREGIPAGMFHGGIPEKQRRETLDAYNRGKIKALLIGPAGAEGISTKGTSLIQLLDPHWNESRGNQAKGRGLRFDSHQDLPPELKNVLIQRYMSTMPEPGRFRRFFGARRERTGDEIVDDLAARKEALNEEFRRLLREVGSQKNAAEPASQDGTYGSYFGSVLGNLGTGVLASGLSGLASIPLTRNSMFTDNNPTSASRRAKEKIVRMMSKHLPVEHAGPAVASMIHTDPGTMKPTGARLGTNVHPATAAHEHGHVVQPRWINKLRKAGLFALPASLAGTFSTDEDTHRNLAMTSSAITGLSVLPSEIDASVRGYRTLSRMRKPMPLPGRLRAFAGLPSYFNAAMLPMLQHEVARRAGTFRTTSEAPAKQAEAPSAGSWLYNLLNTSVTGESAMQAAAAPGRAIHQTVAPAAKWWGDTTAAGYRGVGNLLGRGWNAVSNAVGSVGNAVGGAASAVGNTVAPTNAGSANAPAMTKDITDRMQSAGSAATWIPHPVTIGAGLVGMASPQIAGVVGGHMYNNMTPEMQAHQDIMAAERAGTSAAQMQPPSNRSPEYLKSFETYRSAAQSTADIQRAGGLKQWADQQSAARLKQQVEARRQAASQPSPGSSPSPQANIATQPTYQPPPQAYPVLPWRQAVAQNHPELVQRHPETAPTLPYDHGLGGRSSAAPTSNLASQPVKPPQPVQPPKPVQPPQPVKPPQPVQPPKPPSMASASMPKTPSSIGQPKTASTPILMLHQQAMKKYYASVAKDEKPKAKAAPKTPPPKPPQLNAIPPLDKPPQMGMSAGFGGQSLQQAINERFKIGANSSNTKMTNPLRQQRSNFGRSV